MDDDRNDAWFPRSVSAITSFLNKLINTKLVLRPRNHNDDNIAPNPRDTTRRGGEDLLTADDELSVVGGVEVMKPCYTPTTLPTSSTVSSTSRTSTGDCLLHEKSSPIGNRKKNRVFPTTPYHRGDPPPSSDTSNSPSLRNTSRLGNRSLRRLEAARSPYSCSRRRSPLDRLPVLGLIDVLEDAVNIDSEEQLQHFTSPLNSRRLSPTNTSSDQPVRRKAFNGSSYNSGNRFLSTSSRAGNILNRSLTQSATNRLRIGGNDGLQDVDLEEDMDDDEVVELDKDEVEPEVDIIAHYESPGISKFRFQPTVTSTAERLARHSSRDRKENKWRRRPTVNPKIPLVSRRTGLAGACGMLQRGATRRVTGLPMSRANSRPGGGGSSLISSSIVANKVKARMQMQGLPSNYHSTAQDCYKMVDRQAYEELLASNTSSIGSDVLVQPQHSFRRTPSSMYSITSSSAPLSKTQMGLDWTRQRTLEIENSSKSRLQGKTGVEQNISLWTADEKNRQGAASGDKSQATSGKQQSKDEEGASVVQNKGAKPKSGPPKKVKDDDDDIMITSETLRKVVKPNSLEKNALFRAYYTFNHDWMEDLNETSRRRDADLERQRKESELTIKTCKERRKAAPSVEDAVSFRFQMLDLKHPSPRIDIGDEDVLTELTPDMEKVINEALRKNKPPSEVLTEKFNIQITRRDIATLAGLNWLNDEVVNFYMNLLMERSRNDNYPSVYAFNTFFYPKIIKMGFAGVKRWTKKVDIFSYDLLLVPVHLGMHWCLATVNVKEKLISYYDSMLGNNNQCLQELKKYLQDEHLDKKKTPLDISSWKCETLKDIPQQMNGSDCGMFACKFSEYLSRRKPITFTQDHMPYFRRRMVYEIVTNQLL